MTTARLLKHARTSMPETYDFYDSMWVDYERVNQGDVVCLRLVNKTSNDRVVAR